MPKPIVTDHRYDFRGGRNSSLSSDLLNPNELVDTTNIRLNTIFGGFTKRSGCQRMHSNAWPSNNNPNKIDGCYQWDGPNGKQVVFIANGLFYWRNGFDYSAPFNQTTPIVPGVARSTNNGTDGAKGWNGGATTNSITRSTPGVSTVAAGSRIFCKLGDPNQTPSSNIPSGDNSYTLSGFQLGLNTTAIIGSGGYFNTSVQWETSIDNGASWQPAVITSGPGSASVSTNLPGQIINTPFGSLTFLVAGANVWVRPVLSVGAQYAGWSGNVTGSITVNIGGVIQTFTWVTGGTSSQLGGPVTFIPFRANAAGAPLQLFIASNNHYWSWDGVTNLTQLDPTNTAPAANTIAAYHTRMFAVTQSQPKTLWWSKIGDATNFNTGTKTDGGSALTDFLTGNALIAMEVIGSSLLLATTEAIMRFTGHASDDIVISQDTEGISTEVGVVGSYAMKRYENTCAFMTNRGPYAATETYVQAIGEQLNTDWFALDTVNLPNMSIEYNKARKELWYAVPRQTDGGQCKTLFVQSVRLNAWQGPWTYPFGITYMTKYVDADGQENIMAACNDGFLRLMDVQNPTTKVVLDDILFDGSGGVAIPMLMELPVIHFGIPALKKALKWILIQADLPIGSNPVFNISFDGDNFTPFQVDESDHGAQDYRVDVAGDNSQGFRPRIQFTDDSIYAPTVFGISTIAYNYQRTT